MDELSYSWSLELVILELGRLVLILKKVWLTQTFAVGRRKMKWVFWHFIGLSVFQRRPKKGNIISYNKENNK